jgi:hypothetical protein
LHCKLRLDGELLWDLHTRCGGGRSELATVIAKGKKWEGWRSLSAVKMRVAGWQQTRGHSLK